MGIEITVRRYNNNYCTAISASWCNTFFTSYLNPQSVYMLCKGENLEEYNPLNLNSHLLPLFISYRSSGEKLIKYQANSSCVIVSVILMNTLFYKALIFQGEI